MDLNLSVNILLAVCCSIFISAVTYRFVWGVRREEAANRSKKKDNHQGEELTDARALSTLRKIGETEIRQ